MAVRLGDIELVHRIVGTKHGFTSPDVPRLHVSYADRKTALDTVQSALDMFGRMQSRTSDNA